MPSICFTGPAVIGDMAGSSRKIWIEYAKANGWSVHRACTPSTDNLVASRKDTLKAKDARKYGTTILTYKDLARRWATPTPV